MAAAAGKTNWFAIWITTAVVVVAAIVSDDSDVVVCAIDSVSETCRTSRGISEPRSTSWGASVPLNL